MLPFHIINPEKQEQNDSEFVHYLSLGSHKTSFTNPNIFSFSKIMLNQKKHLPKLNYDILKAKCLSNGTKFHNLVIPMYGCFQLDQKKYANFFESQSNQIQQAHQKYNFENEKNFIVKQCNFVEDVEYIANIEQKSNNATFLYLLYQTGQNNQTKNSLITHQSRFYKQIQFNLINCIPILKTHPEIYFSFIQILSNTKVILQQNDLIYLEKGKIVMHFSQQTESIQIKNKGNRKGQQNYIQNMIFVCEQLKVEIEKGSLIFLATNLK